MTAGIRRRDTLRLAGLTASYLILGQWVQTTPAQAKARGYQPRALSTAQLQPLEVLAEALVPGASAAGIAPYIDAQLAAGPNSLLMAKYVGVPIDAQLGFYSAIATAIDAALHADLQPADLPNLMLGDAVPGWQGPPASYALFVLRADALDVTWGTPEGYADLAIPYRAHIMPESNW